MKLQMSGIDHEHASVALRGQLSFSADEVKQLDRALCSMEGVSGAVLLSTCNRTELYLSGTEQMSTPGELLCRAAGRDWTQFAPVTVSLEGQDAAKHLAEVASGLHSRIWGEDQIITQVGRAAELARAAESTDGVLSTLFRTAVSAGKDVKTHVRFVAVPESSASKAVAELERRLGTLAGKRAVVIGNGEMGRLSARLLHQAGCRVCVTLRTYRHGETLVPSGCDTVPYDQRMEAMEGADIVFSATTSPHYTVTAEQADALWQCPEYWVDLAIPRDIDPNIAKLSGLTVYDIDHFDASPQTADQAALMQAEAIVARHLSEFYRWWDYRSCIPAMTELKAALGRRFAAEGRTEYQPIVDRTVELILGGLQKHPNPEALRACAEKIDAFTRPTHRGLEQEIPFRFPVFTDLRGKRVVIVGGGTIARRRIETLKPFGAELTVIAPELTGSKDGIFYEPRGYQSSDLDGAFLAVAATNDRQVNQMVGEDARTRGIPVSVADAREECTFFFPAICVGEQVLAGVVSRGDDHKATARAAQAIRTVLEDM